MPNSLRLLVLLALLVAPMLGACQSASNSSRASASQVPSLIVLVDHRNNTRMTLLTDAWLRENGAEGEDFSHRRAFFYSQRFSKNSSNAMVKVIPDDLATEFWGYLKDRGFDKYGREGSAPAAGGKVVQALEVSTPKGVRNFSVYAGIDKDEGEAFRTCIFGFMDLYTNVVQMQSVRERPDFGANLDAPGSH
ncbi:MAG: hypothetical protein R3F17_03285 [Planctomycetota bacterium]